PPKVRPLPGRTNVVLTSQPWNIPDCHTFPTVEAFLAAYPPEDHAITGAGGASVYAEFLPLADRLELTQIEMDTRGDTFFPKWDSNKWEITEIKTHREVIPVRTQKNNQGYVELRKEIEYHFMSFTCF